MNQPTHRIVRKPYHTSIDDETTFSSDMFSIGDEVRLVSAEPDRVGDVKAVRSDQEDHDWYWVAEEVLEPIVLEPTTPETVTVESLDAVANLLQHFEVPPRVVIALARLVDGGRK